MIDFDAIHHEIIRFNEGGLHRPVYGEAAGSIN